MAMASLWTRDVRFSLPIIAKEVIIMGFRISGEHEMIRNTGQGFLLTMMNPTHLPKVG